MKLFTKWNVVYCCVLILTLLSAHFGSQAVTVFSETAPIERTHTIIIDAGHGGIDGGATSCTGVLESNLNLEISRRLNDVFRFLGYYTVMTRTEDVSIYTEGSSIAAKKASDLKERVRIANETENGLLISIHQNIFPVEEYSGAQIFFADTEGSRTLAALIQDMYIKNLNPGSSRREKKSSGIYLMEHIRIPGVLIECGFLSNPEEEAKLRNKEYQLQLCSVIAASVSRFLSNT